MMALALLLAAASASPTPAGLCEPPEVSLFSCPIRHKTVSICAIKGKATYRYGTPGDIELSSNALHMAKKGTSGGGETQITFANEGVTYIIFDKTVRTTFGGNGNTPDFVSGLAVRKAGKTIASTECGTDASIPAKAKDYIPEGTFLEH